MSVLPQVLTIVGTLGGALLGLLAPLISTMLTRREHDRDVQRGIASDIMGIFEDGVSPVVLLSPKESGPRRRLYLLGLRLNDAMARRACMTLIARSAQSPLDEDKVLEAWQQMMNEVGSVYRRSRESAKNDGS